MEVGGEGAKVQSRELLRPSWVCNDGNRLDYGWWRVMGDGGRWMGEWRCETSNVSRIGRGGGIGGTVVGREAMRTA